MQLSCGPYSYNRFDAFEKSLEENREAASTAGESEGKKAMRTAGKPAKVTGGKTYVEKGKDGKPLFSEGTGASDPFKMKAEVDAAAVKKKQESAKLKKGDKKQEAKQEKTTFSGVDESVEQIDEVVGAVLSGVGSAVGGAAQGIGKAVGGVAKGVGSAASGAAKGIGKAAGGVHKGVKSAVSPDSGGVKEETDELNTDETTETVMENRMAMYSRALGVMGAHYSGPGFGVSSLEEKKKDDESTDERKAAADRSAEEKRQEKEGKKGEAKETEEIEKNEDEDIKDGRPWLKGKKKDVEEGWQPLPKARMARQADRAYGKERQAVRAGDEAGVNKQMQRRIAMTDPKGRNAQLRKEDISITKEMVVEYLVSEGYASNEVSAEVLHTHVSDEFLAQIEESMIAEMGPAHPVETEQQAEAQKDRRSGKKNREGNKTAKNPGTQKGEGYNTAN